MTSRARAGAWALALTALLAACGGGVDSPSPERRAEAIRALSKESGDRPVPALLVAQRDPSPLVRRAAAEALAARRGPDAGAALGAMLGDTDAAVAAAAATGLARLGDLEAARRALTEGYALATPDGRSAIAQALAEIGISLRDAVEAEARRLWARNVAVLSNGSPEARAGAAEELGASGRSDAVARLRELVSRPGEDRRVVVAALRGLGEAGDFLARPTLERALEAAEPEVAAAAAHALGRLGDPGATGPLARLAAAGSGPLHLAALDALETLPSAPEVSFALCGIAVRTGSPRVAALAARAAWTRNGDCPPAALAARAGRGDPAALAAIIELHPEGAVLATLAGRLVAAVSDPRSSGELRARAATALGRLDWEAAGAGIEARARAVNARIAALRTGWVPGRLTGEPSLPEEREASVGVLLARPPALPPRAPGAPEVPEWLDTTPPADAQELGALLTALGRLRVGTARDLLAGGVNDPVESIRAGAIEGLGYAAGGNAPTPELGRALTDPSERVRSAALRVLPRYGPAAVPALEGAVARALGGDERWAAGLARALGETGAPSALRPLALLLDGPAPAAAAIAIAALGASEGAEPLLARLARKEAPGRVEMLDALAQLASHGAGPAFEAELLSERPDVRAAGARAIGRLRYEPASGRLEALRVDYDGRVRRATIEALAKLPSGRPGAR